MISVTLTSHDGSQDLLVGLDQKDMRQLRRNSPKLISLDYVGISPRGRLIITRLKNGVAYYPADKQDTDYDIAVTLEDDELDGLELKDDGLGYADEDMPFRLVLFYRKTEDDIRQFIEDTLDHQRIRSTGCIADRYRPSIN